MSQYWCWTAFIIAKWSHTITYQHRSEPTTTTPSHNYDNTNTDNSTLVDVSDSSSHQTPCSTYETSSNQVKPNLICNDTLSLIYHVNKGGLQGYHNQMVNIGQHPSRPAINIHWKTWTITTYTSNDAATTTITDQVLLTRWPGQQPLVCLVGISVP